MNEVLLLKIEAAVPSAVFLNGNACGVAGEKPVYIHVPKKSLTLSFSPLGGREGRLYLPFSRVVEFQDDACRIIEDDGRIRLCFLGDVLKVEAFPPFLYAPALPCTAALLNFSLQNRRYRAEVVMDGGLFLLLTDQEDNIPFALPLPESFESARLFLRRMGETPYLLAEGKESLACVNLNRFSLEFLCEEAGYRFSESGLELLLNSGDPYGKRLVRSYAPENEGLSPEGEKYEQCEEALPKSEENTLRAFLAALRFEAWETARSYLAPGLQSALLGDALGEFFGEVARVLPDGEESAYICRKVAEHIFAGSKYAFSFENGFIGNISEL